MTRSTLSLIIAFLLLACSTAAYGQATLLKDIHQGFTPNYGSAPAYFAEMNGIAYFVASTSLTGDELWRSDGTAAGTWLVFDIYSGGFSSFNVNPLSLVTVGNTLFFTADDGQYGRELWKSDGTAAGTSLVKDLIPGKESTYLYNLTAVNGMLYFSCSTDSEGSELWRSDGTESGTYMVKDINPGPNDADPQNFIAYNGSLFFTAKNATNGTELWKSNGTELGTTMVKDIEPGIGSGAYFPFEEMEMTVSNNKLFFKAGIGLDIELYVTTGFSFTTHRVKDINPGLSSSNIKELTDVNGTLYFSAETPTGGAELWKSDGTSLGTVLVEDIFPGNANHSYPEGLTAAGSILYFTAIGSVGEGRELWRSLGTAANTYRVKDIYPGPTSPEISDMTYRQGVVYFIANDGVNGRELWRTTGGNGTTYMVKDINGIADASIYAPFLGAQLTLINNTLFFGADNGSCRI